jgi:ABC-type multidrug transport system fused ATPase/permease subunit
MDNDENKRDTLFRSLIRMLEAVLLIDWGAEKARNFHRTAALAVYVASETQIELFKARSVPSFVHSFLMVIHLFILIKIRETSFSWFNYEDEMQIRAIMKHQSVIQSQLRVRMKGDTTNSDRYKRFLERYHIACINHHVSQTSLMHSYLKALNVIRSILTHRVLSPLSQCLFLIFLDTVCGDIMRSVDTHEAMSSESDEQQETIACSVAELVDNYNIISECGGEGEYFEGIYEKVKSYINIKREYNERYPINKCDMDFENRFALYLHIYGSFTSSDATLAFFNAELEYCLTRLASDLYRVNQERHVFHKACDELESYQLGNINETAPAPDSTERATIHPNKSRFVFLIRPFALMSTDSRLLFSVERSIHIISGQWTSLTGESGSGKTTLCELLLRTCMSTCSYEKFIYFLNKRNNHYKHDEIRHYVSYLRPSADLFNRSIEFNILYGVRQHRKTKAKMLTLLVQYGLSHLTRRLGRNIQSLSSGEKQRIKIIRCILQDKPIWILDEATSNIDEKYEAIVLSSLRSIQSARQKTVIHITHNTTHLDYADVCLMIENRFLRLKAPGCRHKRNV